MNQITLLSIWIFQSFFPIFISKLNSMKKLLLTLVAIFNVAITQAQTSEWLWSKTAGGNFQDASNSVCTDHHGNVFIAGSFESPAITFGSYTLNNPTTSGSTRNSDLFVVKYDSTGNVLWATSAGGTSNDIAYSVCADSSGNVFVTGSFSSLSLVFGSYTLTCSTHNDLFIVKYDPAGNVLWAKSANGSGSAGNGIYENDISTDLSGNVFVTGAYTSPTFTFGTITLTNNASPGYSNTYLAKYDASGNVLWAHGFGGSGGAQGGNNIARSIVTDSSGNVFITGGFACHQIIFGPDTLINADAVNTNTDVFYVKFDPSGNALWAKRQGGTGNEDGNSISIDANGNLFISAYFNNYSSFLAKYDPTGNVLWSKNAGGFFKSTGTDNNGNVFATGYFYQTISFGPYTLTNNGFKDPFLVKYDSLGNVYWARTATEYGSGFNMGNGVSTDQNGNAYITGQYSSNYIIFDTTLNNVGFSSCPGGCADAFMAKFRNSNAFITGNTILCAGQSTTLTVTTPATNYLWNTGETTASIIVSPTVTSTYSVAASTGTFTAIATTVVTVNPNPQPTAAFSYSTGGFNVILTEASVSGAGDPINTWHWEFPGAGSATSSNLQNPGPVYYYVSGTYTVCLTVTSSMRCTDMACDTIHMYIASVKEQEGLTSLIISPNPFSVSTTLHSEVPLQNATATLYNCMGQTVSQIKNINGDSYTLSRNDLPGGLYFVHLAQDNKTISVNKMVIADD